MVNIPMQTIAKIVRDDEPQFKIKTRRYSGVKTAAVPVPDMELTKHIDKGMEAKIWIEKQDTKIIMLVVIDGEKSE